ncbi:putative serine/threonine protein kinase [Frankia canadensis]|uniref:Putative serine/threonine protein kinase n=1 Tax=Frankia canadensis TaxID=1836972 RepID=A0A2I2KV87_9ACTN|nr:serine/threonine-protein kinase [Frankia canadensis]SNQ49572.1 putative serine/threonine protein kinase [Frankia canadensis]SOU56862.1 putative serine/threonine protein kinase [Frankia canadensis]
MPVIDRERVIAALPGYAVGDELGSGAYGLVLAGRHLGLGRDVAIKVMTAGLAGSAVAMAGFRTEARILSRLEHPHIVRVHDYVDGGQVDHNRAGNGDLALLVMELLGGGTLTRQRLGQRAACAVALAVADGLATAHEAGVLHRDVKPDNILFTEAGQPKLSDFGIAKIFDGTASTASRVVGTGRYMAPEQITGGRLGPWTDLYALGVLLHEQFTGRPLFGSGLSVPELFRHHLQVIPAAPAGVPEGVAAVVMRALAKQPGQRQPDARVFAHALALAAVRAYGPDWTAGTGIVLRLPEELRDPVRHRARRARIPAGLGGSGPRADGAAGATDPFGGDGPAGRRAARFARFVGIGGIGGTGGAGGWKRRRVAFVAAAAAVVLAAAGGVTYLAVGGRDSDRMPGWVPTTLAAGRITVAIGLGTEGFSGDGGPASQAALNSPRGITVDRHGDLYVADTGNNRIRRVDRHGTITTVAGSGIHGFAGDGGPATRAKLASPVGVAVSDAGDLYIADQENRRVRRVAPNGVITTVAGTGKAGYSGTNDPPSPGFSSDGVPAVFAQISGPSGVALGPDGSLLVADGGNMRVRRIDRDGLISTVVGSGGYGFGGDGGPATGARLTYLDGMTIDPSDGGLYVTDSGNNRVRHVDPRGIITTVAGNGTAGFAGDGGPATRAQLTGYGAAVAPGDDGTLYLADASAHRIRRIDPRGIITTIAGTGTSGSAGLGGPATGAEFAWPENILYYRGYLLVCDANAHRIDVIAVKPGTSGRGR